MHNEDRYSREKIERYSVNLHGKAAFVGVYYAILYPAVWVFFRLALLTVFTLVHGIEQVVSLGKIKFPPEALGSDAGVGMVFFFIVGIAVGVAKSQKYRIQAQMMLCELEQEKHLRFIAERMFKDGPYNSGQ